MRQPLIVVIALWTGAAALAQTTNVPGLVRLDLRDGCRLIGETSTKELRIATEQLGELTVPFDRVSVIQCTATQEIVQATITFRNGDILRGRLLLTAFPLKTCFASVSVPLATITHVTAGQPNGDPAEPPIPLVLDPQSMARRVINQARQLDAAIDQWALEKGQTNGSVVNFREVATYLRDDTLNSEFYKGGTPKDLLGQRFITGLVGPDQVHVNPRTKAALKDAGLDWGAY